MPYINGAVYYQDRYNFFVQHTLLLVLLFIFFLTVSVAVMIFLRGLTPLTMFSFMAFFVGVTMLTNSPLSCEDAIHHLTQFLDNLAMKSLSVAKEYRHMEFTSRAEMQAHVWSEAETNNNSTGYILGGMPIPDGECGHACAFTSIRIVVI